MIEMETRRKRLPTMAMPSALDDESKYCRSTYICIQLRTKKHIGALDTQPAQFQEIDI